MKIITLFIGFLLFFEPGRTQVLKFKAVQFICTKYQNQPLDPPEFQDCHNMLVEFNQDSSFLRIHSPNIQLFTLERKPIFMQEKDSVLFTLFAGKNAKGEKCRILFKLYERETDKYWASVTIEYPDKIFMYYLQKE
jgi:hypothetical protein